MGNPLTKDTQFLVHIEHSKPIELASFTSAMTAVGNLYSDFVKEHGGSSDMAKSKLYVEKIEKGSIDIYLQELVAAGLLAMEETNTIIEFASHVKKVFEYFCQGKGEEPSVTVQDCDNISNALAVTANDNNGCISFGAVANGNTFNNCTFNFTDSGNGTYQATKKKEQLKEERPEQESYENVLMTIDQLRAGIEKNVGNKAIIESISKKSIPVTFDNQDLKNTILHSNENPIKYGFMVDIVLLKSQGRTVYKVVKLHDIISFED